MSGARLIIGVVCANILAAGSLVPASSPPTRAFAVLDDDGATELDIVVPLGMAVEVRVDWLTGEIVGRAIAALPVAEDHTGFPLGGCIVVAPLTSGPAQSPVTFAPLCLPGPHTTPITMSVLACFGASQCVSHFTNGAAFGLIVCQNGGFAVQSWSGGGANVVGCAIILSGPLPSTWASWSGTIYRSGPAGMAIGFHQH